MRLPSVLKSSLLSSSAEMLLAHQTLRGSKERTENACFLFCLFATVSIATYYIKNSYLCIYSMQSHHCILLFFNMWLWLYYEIMSFFGVLRLFSLKSMSIFFLKRVAWREPQTSCLEANRWSCVVMVRWDKSYLIGYYLSQFIVFLLCINAAFVLAGWERLLCGSKSSGSHRVRNRDWPNLCAAGLVREIRTGMRSSSCVQTHGNGRVWEYFLWWGLLMIPLYSEVDEFRPRGPPPSR